ncbi:hypothetical protein ACLBWX_16625 [Methylobacterium sp. M6A4_1b]
MKQKPSQLFASRQIDLSVVADGIVQINDGRRVRQLKVVLLKYRKVNQIYGRRIRDLHRGEASILKDQCSALLLQCSMLVEAHGVDESRAAVILDGSGS